MYEPIFTRHLSTYLKVAERRINSVGIWVRGFGVGVKTPGIWGRSKNSCKQEFLLRPQTSQIPDPKSPNFLTLNFRDKLPKLQRTESVLAIRLMP